MPIARIYLAAPLFTLAERRMNVQFAEALEGRLPKVRVLLPQRHAQALKGRKDFGIRMYRWCLESIECCDAMVALADGADVDSGTCVEIGYAKAKGKIIVGVRTDFRASEEHGLNLMVARSCSRLVSRSSVTTTLDRLAASVANHLQRMLSY